MELRQLEAFVAVADELSFTRASERLGTTQSAVSGAVRRLEDSLGVRLLDRTTHEVQATDAGRVLLPEARRTLAAAAAARGAVEEVAGGLRGTVRLGTLTADALVVSVGAILARFGAEHPRVDVVLRHSSLGSADLAEQVRDHRLDLAFVAINRPLGPGLQAVRLSEDPMVLATAVGQEPGGGGPLRLRDIAGLPFADGPAGWGTRIVADGAFAAAGLVREVRYEVNDSRSVVDLVRNGLAVSLLPGAIVAGAPGIATAPVRDAPRFVTGLASSTTWPLGPAARALAGTIAEVAAELSPGRSRARGRPS
jgi:DNA-binding transcriptional LysR family regulator